MRNWAFHKALSKQHKIRTWKKKHLYGNPVMQVMSPKQPVFKANSSQQQRTQELEEFLSRLRHRS